MLHPFSNALYYPYIDIKNSAWLKTAILFWDSISTIVPESLEDPYCEPDTRRLADAGILRPLRINSDDIAVTQIEDDIMSILSSPEIIQSCFFPNNPTPKSLYAEKLSHRVRDEIQNALQRRFFPEKLSWTVRREVERAIEHHGEIFHVEPLFASVYMLALANKLSELNALALITDEVSSFPAGNALKLGNQSNMLVNQRYVYQNRALAQGLLLDYIIEGISISSENSIQQIVDFRDRHRDELGRFKLELAKLTEDYNDTDIPLDQLQHQIEDVYRNRFLPSYSDLKHALRGFGITWFTNSFLKISGITVSTTGVPMALLGMPIEKALFASMGLSVIAAGASYRVEKEKMLRENPYSYLLSVNQSNIVR